MSELHFHGMVSTPTQLIHLAHSSCTIHIVTCKLHYVHYIMHIVLSLLHYGHCPMYKMYIALWALNSAHCTMRIALCTLHYAHSTIHTFKTAKK